MTRRRLAAILCLVLLVASGGLGWKLWFGARQFVVGGRSPTSVAWLEGPRRQNLRPELRPFADLVDDVLVRSDRRIAARLEAEFGGVIFLESPGIEASVVRQRSEVFQLAARFWTVSVLRRNGFRKEWVPVEGDRGARLAAPLARTLATITEEEFERVLSEIETRFDEDRARVRELVRLRLELRRAGAPPDLRELPIETEVRLWSERVARQEELREQWSSWLADHPTGGPPRNPRIEGTPALEIAEPWVDWAVARRDDEPDLSFTLRGGRVSATVVVEGPAGIIRRQVRVRPSDPSAEPVIAAGAAAIDVLSPATIRSLVAERVRGIEDEHFGGATPVQLTVGSLSERLAMLDDLEAALAGFPENAWFSTLPFGGVRFVGVSPIESSAPRWVDAPGPRHTWRKCLEIPVGSPVGAIRLALADPG